MEKVTKILKIVVALGVFTATVWGYIIYQRRIKDFYTAKRNSEVAMEAVKLQSSTIAFMAADLEKLIESNKQYEQAVVRVTNDLRDTNEQIRRLEKKSIGELVKVKPKLVEKAVNRGTKISLRCLEIASGAKPNENENTSDCLSVAIK